jgi:hypothetical protein
MFHKGARTMGGNLGDDLVSKINRILDEFANIVAELVSRQNIRRAVVRSMLPCNLIIVLDDKNVSIAAQKSSGMPSTVGIDQKGKHFSSRAVYESARWEFGYDEPFVIQIPSDLINKTTEERNASLRAVAKSYVQSEIYRVQREMNIIQISPIFGPASYTIDPRLAFVLMPFDDDLTEIYNSIIKPTVEATPFDLVCKRADDLKTNKAIIQDIWKAICEARLVIADLTRVNPNVMYELGMAHTVGKETILIYQKEEEIVFPFDLGHIRRIEYENDAPGGKQLERELKSTVENVLSLQVKQN